MFGYPTLKLKTPPLPKTLANKGLLETDRQDKKLVERS